MLLSHMTWRAVETHIAAGGGIVLPTGSTEQHGPMGMIGTDTICATEIAVAAAEVCGAVVAPPLAYTPAPFNMSFPGTMSVSERLFSALCAELLAGLASHGFKRIYVLNGHGANLAPLREVSAALSGAEVRIRSWWDYAEVNAIRQQHYGAWEGMHATPSEIAITQALIGELPVLDAVTEPEKLSPEFIAAHAGDKHGPPDEHRAQFPDGRVGSHSALAKPEHGRALLEAAKHAAAADMSEFFG
jgi:creatinine amidohydrolase